jgi:hypothetical protein
MGKLLIPDILVLVCLDKLQEWYVDLIDMLLASNLRERDTNVEKYIGLSPLLQVASLA